MGHIVEAKCLDCGEKFEIEHGGGFFFHLLRCDKCGKTESIGFDKLGELHLQYLKGLPGPYSHFQRLITVCRFQGAEGAVV